MSWDVLTPEERGRDEDTYSVSVALTVEELSWLVEGLYGFAAGEHKQPYLEARVRELAKGLKCARDNLQNEIDEDIRKHGEK